MKLRDFKSCYPKAVIIDITWFGDVGPLLKMAGVRPYNSSTIRYDISQWTKKTPYQYTLVKQKPQLLEVFGLLSHA